MEEPQPEEEKSVFQLSKEQKEYILQFNFEIWYPILKQIRIDNDVPVCVQTSISIELSKEEMKLIYQYNELRNFTMITPSKENELNVSLKPLMECIDSQIDRKTDYFIKLGTRSPKDILGGIRPCSSGKEALNQLTESKRVYHDLFWFVDPQSELNSSMFLHFIAWREFEKDKEIRCFVYQSKLVAITQYDLENTTILSQQEAACVHIVDKLVQFIADKIPYKDYVIDVEVNPGISIYLVEFNPWGLYGTTSPVLFDWEKDASILYCENPISVCVRTQRHGYKSRKEQVTIPKLSSKELEQYRLVQRDAVSTQPPNPSKSLQTEYLDDDWMQMMQK